MPDNNSSDSEKNFDISDQASTSFDPTPKRNLPDILDTLDLVDDFVDESGDEMAVDDEENKAARVSDRARFANASTDDGLWGKIGSSDVDQLHQLRELYQTRQKRTEEDDEQEYLDLLKESNTDELQSLRQATAVLETFENQPYVEEPVTSKAPTQRRIRPQRFVAGAARYPNKLMLPSRSTEEPDEEPQIEDEGIGKPEKPDDRGQLVNELGETVQVEKHKRISREVAKLRFSNPGNAFIDHFNLDDEGGASLDLEFGQRATRRAKVDASDRLRGASSAVQTRSRTERPIEFISPQRPQSAKPVIYHNESGHLLVNDEMVGDPCDCLVDSCSGCFFGCPECGSNKCGPICRSRRTQFVYCVAESRQKSIQPVRYNPHRGAIRRESPTKMSPEKCI